MQEQCGAIAQLGERLNGIQEVVGSIPIGSTSSLLYLLEIVIFLKVSGFRTPLKTCLKDWPRSAFQHFVQVYQRLPSEAKAFG